MIESSQFLMDQMILFAIQLLAIGLALFVMTRSSRQAQADALLAQKAAATAQAQATNAAASLIASQTEANEKMRSLTVTVDATHRLVNNQRTLMVRMVNDLAQRVARENPRDHDAQVAAVLAHKDMTDADYINEPLEATSASVMDPTTKAGGFLR